jgi:DNA-directed RNA polymerase subunit RPC12/RpoP
MNSANPSLPACPCNVCSAKIEFEPSRAGETIACPHCGMDTLLYIPSLSRTQTATLLEAPAAQVPAHGQTLIQIGLGAQAAFARRKRGSKTSPAGIICELIGFILLFLFPIGTILGIALMIAGYQVSRIWRCSNCGNVITDKEVLICPTCKSQMLP